MTIDTFITKRECVTLNEFWILKAVKPRKQASAGYEVLGERIFSIVPSAHDIAQFHSEHPDALRVTLTENYAVEGLPKADSVSDLEDMLDEEDEYEEC